MIKENKGIKLGLGVGALLAAVGGICYAVYKWEQESSKSEPEPQVLGDQSKAS
jgi:uncharacterized membrane protein YebE (DUF533 family)